MKNKFMSRKFLICLAAFLSAVATELMGYFSDNKTLMIIGASCKVLSAGIYAACEAHVDAAHCNDITIEEIDGDE